MTSESILTGKGTRTLFTNKRLGSAIFSRISTRQLSLCLLQSVDHPLLKTERSPGSLTATLMSLLPALALELLTSSKSLPRHHSESVGDNVTVIHTLRCSALEKALWQTRQASFLIPAGVVSPITMQPQCGRMQIVSYLLYYDRRCVSTR